MADLAAAYKKGWKIKTLFAEEHQVGAPDSIERKVFWKGVFDRAQYELRRIKVKEEGD